MFTQKSMKFCGIKYCTSYRSTPYTQPGTHFFTYRKRRWSSVGRLLTIGGPLIKFLPCLAKIQCSLPCGKKRGGKRKEGRENTKQRETLPPRVGFSSPNHQYHTIRIVPLRCRNSLSTSCRLYNPPI